MVSKRDRQTLIPIILKYIRPGTEIHSDRWRAYYVHRSNLDHEQNTTLENLDETAHMNYAHNAVDHSSNFVDPITHVNTQTVEGLWSAKLKCRFKTMKGVYRTHLQSHIDERMYRSWHGGQNSTIPQRFHNIFKAILNSLIIVDYS